MWLTKTTPTCVTTQAEKMAASCKRICSAAIGSFVATAVEYDTPKIVHIKNKKVGILNRLVQLGILAYVIV